MDRIGRYKIIGELGRGAMGVVYKAQDPAIGRMIAIKSIKLEALTDDNERARMRERLFREAQTAGILSHPGIVTIYDIAEEDGMAYIFMELVNGPSFDKLLRLESPLKGNAIVDIFRQVAHALDYAHKKGIVHRDIKPANIMVHDDSTAKITDFGVAKIISQQLTHAGLILGTPSYMSPEQIQGVEVSGRSDQFSLAVVAYEVLTGEKPFTAEHMPSLLFKIVREDPAPAHRLNPALPSAVHTVLQKGLAKNPADRFETCAEFVYELTSALPDASTWTAMKHGASGNVATGSKSTYSSTMIETVAVNEPTSMSSQVDPQAETVIDAAPVVVRPQSPQISVPERPDEPAASTRSRHRTLLWVGIAAASVIAVLAARFFIQTPKQPSGTVAQSTVPEVAPAVEPKAAPPAESPTQQTAPVAVTPAVPSAPTPTEAAFRLTTNPEGAEAIFDGDPNLRCTSPCAMNLSLARHTVTIKHPGYRETQRFFTLPNEPGLIVNMEQMMGTLVLTTNPSGLSVVIDGQEQTRKTPTSINLTAGPHRVQVLRGTERQDFTVDIRDGVLSQKNIEWGN